MKQLIETVEKGRTILVPGVEEYSREGNNSYVVYRKEDIDRMDVEFKWYYINPMRDNYKGFVYTEEEQEYGSVVSREDSSCGYRFRTMGTNSEHCGYLSKTTGHWCSDMVIGIGVCLLALVMVVCLVYVVYTYWFG